MTLTPALNYCKNIARHGSPYDMNMVRLTNSLNTLPPCAPLRYGKAFAKLDKDKNGFLSSAEARPMLAKAVANRLTESQLGGVWRMADIDGDGRLSREEVS